MIDTSSFETSVVISKFNEKGGVVEISQIDNNKNVVAIQKIRQKKVKEPQNQQEEMSNE